MSKCPFLMLGFLLVLAGCARTDAGYRLTFDASGQTRKQELLDASVRMLQRRLDLLGQSMRGRRSAPEGSGAVIRFAASDTQALETLTQTITAPFQFRLMTEAPKEQADIYNEQYGGYRETGITEKDVTWVEAAASSNGRGTAVIGLTPQGQERLGRVFAENREKEIGIFVRGKLMSRKFVTEKDTENNKTIQIDNIPSREIASIFADDMNVGVHVTFQPLQETASSSSTSSSNTSASQASTASAPKS